MPNEIPDLDSPYGEGLPPETIEHLQVLLIKNLIGAYFEGKTENKEALFDRTI